MANLSIARIGQKIFTPTKNVAKSTNPFAQNSFKGNVLTADVFETKVTKKNKLTYSALVGSLNDAFPTFRKIAESVVAFGNRMIKCTTSIAHSIKELGNKEINIDIIGAGKAIKSGIISMVDEYSIQKLKKYNVSQLETMWKNVSGIVA